ncbi:Bicoid-interacting protein 3-domain-containing protein [Tirmania nivea]|nr:Bicoid-interacting protein 3-domain-containing protein [Tirmania nivea]
MAQYGNYKGYQGASRLQDGKARATHVDDERLKVIAGRVDLQGMDILDVGCNTGYITVQAALSYNAKSVTGIDIDEDLLDHARSHLSFRYSRLCPTLTAPHMNLLQDAYLSQSAPPKARRDRVNYFPISSVQRHGHLPYAQHVAGRQDSQDGNKEREGVIPSFPLNVTFKKEDWGAFSLHEEMTHNSRVMVPKEEYNVILALSVIKWLHLEHGDNGLHTFFDNCHRALRHNGHLVIEIQTYDSYSKAVRNKKAPHLKLNLENLHVKPEDFDAILEKKGLRLVETYTALPREIKIYQKLE